MSDHPKVFIIMLNYNGIDVLNNCLRSVFEIDYPNYEILLLDNGSTDNSLESARESFPQITFIENNENLGFAKANNIGIEMALKKGADYVLLLNNDTLVEKNFLSILTEKARENKKWGIVSPLIYQGNKKDIWFSRGKIDLIKMKTLHETKKISSEPYHSSFITGCSMLIRREVLEKVGLLDEDYFLYWEDADFCWRAQKAGFETMIIPQSNIYHLEISETVTKNKVYRLVLGALIFFKKNSPWYLRPWIFFFVSLRKLKNFLDTKDNENENAKWVAQAYKDFKNV